MTLYSEKLNELYSHLNEFRHKGEFCDIVIKVEGQPFPCHRNILASAMKYFRAEFKKGDEKEIELKWVKAKDFELLLTHVYGKEIKIENYDTYRILRISHFLGLPSLENAVTDYIISNCDSIPLNTALAIFTFACHQENNKLISNLLGIIAKNFVTISKYPKFCDVPGKYLQQLLTDPKIDKDSTSVLDFLRRWAKHQGDEGKKFLPKLLTVVNLSEVSKEWYVRMFTDYQVNEYDYGDNAAEDEEKSPGITNENDPLDQIFAGKDIVGEIEDCIDDNYFQPFFIMTLDNMEESQQSVGPVVNSYKFTSREETHDVHFLRTEYDLENQLLVFCKSVFVDGFRFTIACIELSPVKQLPKYNESSSYKYYFCVFVRHCDSPTLLHVHTFTKCEKIENITMAVNGTHIYLYSEVEFIMYDTQLNEWIVISKSTVHKNVLSSNLLSHKNCLYLIGGKFPLQSTSLTQTPTNGKSFQKFDPREGQKWSMMPNLTYTHYKSASCIYEDKLYVSGGDNLAHFKGYIECYDFKAGKWNVIDALMPEPKMNHTMLARDNQLWFFGGQIRTSEMGEVANSRSWYAYDMTEQTWSNISRMPESYGKFKTQRILDVVVEM